MSPQPRNHPTPALGQRLRAVWTVLGKHGRVALVLAGVAAVVLLLGAFRFGGAVLADSSGAHASSAEDEKAAAERLKKAFEGHLAQVNGRSMFFDPPPPRREPAKVADTDDKPSAPPSRYGGPALLGFAHDSVFFADGRRLRVGDDTDKTLKVVKVNAPWSATVLWENVEFTVSLFDKDKVVLSDKKPGDKPVEGEPGPENDGFVGPPKPSEGAVANSSEQPEAEAPERPKDPTVIPLTRGRTIPHAPTNGKTPSDQPAPKEPGRDRP